MKHTILKTLILAIALAGCAASGPEIVTNPVGRFDFPGYSIVPPLGSGWQMMRDENGVVFRKEAGSTTHTYVALVERLTGFDAVAAGFVDYATDPVVFAAFVKASAEQTDPAVGRTNLIEHEVVADKRFGHCARAYTKTLDQRPPFAPNVLTEEQWSYLCLRPDSARVIIRVAFSEGGLPGESDPKAAEIREGFFNGFQIAGTVNMAAVPAAATAAEHPSVVFIVKESQRSAVRAVANRFKPSIDFGFEGDSKSIRASYTVLLTLSSTVDSSGQQRNRDGAAIGGFMTKILGAVTPWPCTATHTLSALVSDPAGKQVGTYQLTQTETLIGSMVWCPDLKEPGKSVALELVDELLKRIAADAILTKRSTGG